MEQLDLRGTHRRPDHATSIKAAGKVRRFTIRETVEHYARDCGRDGFTDDDLKRIWAGKPESSFRKRRTELAQENRILDTGLTRTNRFGHDEIVWVHRSFHPSPPPVQERDTAPKQSKLARAEAQVKQLHEALTRAHQQPYEERDQLRGQVADLLDMVALAIPYVEEAVDHDDLVGGAVYSSDGRARIRALVRRMRAAVEAN